MSHSLDGKMAVVTGGTQGIGFAIAKELVEEGATVVATGRDQRRLDEAVATIGQKASGVWADAGSPTAMDALLKDVKAARADWRGARDRPGRGVPWERRVKATSMASNCLSMAG
jgi:NAD(P)-dependent dehydrogenase (short-subunit alcohol dehydrogenase family)